MAGSVSTLLGVNHHYHRGGYGIWDASRERPRPVVVDELRRAHVSLVRYPGGIVANLFRWDSAIGDVHRCQVDARVNGLLVDSIRCGVPPTGRTSIWSG